MATRPNPDLRFQFKETARAKIIRSKMLVKDIVRVSTELSPAARALFHESIARVLGDPYRESISERRATGDIPSARKLDIAARLEKVKEELTKLPADKQSSIANGTLARLEREIENANRATWIPEPGKPDRFLHLRHLSAPAFIKEVWKDKIVDGCIDKDSIIEHDEPLFDAYAGYVAQRKFRKRDMGDADGLTIRGWNPRKRRPKHNSKQLTVI